MRYSDFIQDERGATTAEWLMLVMGLTVVATGVVYIIESGMTDVSKNMTAIVEDTVRLPGSSTDAPVINTRMRTPEFNSAAPMENAANGITWAAPNVAETVGSAQVSQWLPVALSQSEIGEGRARVSTLNDDELLELVASYQAYSGALPGDAKLDRVMCDKYHIALNEAEARGIVH